MGPGKRYPKELKERAVRPVLEEQGQHPSQWAAIQTVAAKLGCGVEGLRKWVRRAEADAGKRQTPVTSVQHTVFSSDFVKHE